MAIHAAKNPYLGINAHVNSFLQAKAGEWESFHSAHIIHIYEALNESLPSGYYARSERSLQISELVLAVPDKPQRTRADVLIYRMGDTETSSPALVAEPIKTYDTTLLLEYEAPRFSVIIHQTSDHKPVTRIELLSPANKIGGSHHKKYKERRLETLQSGLCLVELDYLHELPPIIPGHPSYEAGDENATPYLIAATDPRPTFEAGIIRVYGFGVDQPIPIIPIPLAENEEFAFDFGIPYNRSYETDRFFRLTIDYSQPPLHFDRYHPADRERIEQRMKLIAAEQTPK